MSDAQPKSPTRSGKSSPPGSTKAKHATSGRGRVLIVDDDLVVLESLRQCLTDAGFEVETRSQPLGTSQWIAQNDVDIVLLDLTMPAMNGADLATFLKKRGLTRRLSVILHSGKNGSELGPTVKLTGALGAIVKTSDTASFLGEFERLVDRHFRMKEGQVAPKKPGKP
jgi:PleD family two-component response regulator